MGTNDEIHDNQEVKPGQVQENQGQPAPETNQPVEVELADGTRVSLEELKSGYMKDGDYRRKTAEVADERRRVQQERDAARAYQPERGQPYREPVEEPEPIELVAREVVALRTAYARDYLGREIDKLAAKYPDADKDAVFAACWSNPNAIIANEMDKNQSIIQAKIAARMPKSQAPATLDEFFKLNPKAKEEYDRKREEDYLRKKAMKSSATKTVSGGSSGSAETVHEKESKPANYREATENLKKRFAEEDNESF